MASHCTRDVTSATHPQWREKFVQKRYSKSHCVVVIVSKFVYVYILYILRPNVAGECQYCRVKWEWAKPKGKMVLITCMWTSIDTQESGKQGSGVKGLCCHLPTPKHIHAPFNPAVSHAADGLWSCPSLRESLSHTLPESCMAQIHPSMPNI